ncbi:flavin-dependent oxidoreductase [Actinomadura fulvescens]|uniref:Flavin-dependent oxidoreductase n=1 Tax=Actinomadura fulvescens TaxID=46160 RepID=A0ABP6BUG6_9ACTN
MRVLIAGAGIGGLTAALSLHAAGIEALVAESAAKLAPSGVGINLLPHAVRELTELGLGDELAATAIPTGEMVHFDRHGGRIWGEPRGTRLGYRWPQYSVHRGELQMILLAAVRSRLGDGAVREGTPLESFDESPTGVRARLRGDDTVTADVLVGADGLHSRVRARLHPGEPPPLWNGIRMWRGLTEAEPFLTGRTLAVAGSNSRAKFVVYPVSERNGRALLNWVAEVRLPDGSPGPADWDRTGNLGEVLPHFADWRFDWLDVPALLKSTGQILQYPMVDRDPLPFWSRGRVTLLGDAAHPMYPIGSNGGSQAILDARVLAYELARAASPAEGLAAYDRARRETVNAIVLANRRMPADRVLHMVGERAPHGFARIEDVLTAEELAAITGAYRQTSFADAEALNARPSWGGGS